MNIKSVTHRGSPVSFWDDGFGLLWVYRETCGVVGVVRARSFEQAFNAAIDELMYDADIDDMDEESKAAIQRGDSVECVHWRSSGVPSNLHNRRKTGIAQEDPVGSSLDPLTKSLAEELGLEVVWDDPDEDSDAGDTK